MMCGLCVVFALSCVAHAERADRSKPVNIEADRMNADDNKQTATFEGNVVLTQGTFVLHANKLVIRKDDAGFQYASAFGKPATFREKRDGVDEYIDGEALRIEYDGKREFIELFDDARLTRNKDEVRGSYITYDTRADYFTVQTGKGAPAAQNKSGSGRVSATFQPPPKNNREPKPNSDASPASQTRPKPEGIPPR